MESIDQVDKHPRLSILVSHAFLRKNEKFIEIMISLSKFADVLIDSGAYSNHSEWIKKIKSGKSNYTQITVEDYNKACTIYDKYMWGYLTLDKINDPNETWKNYNSQLDAGLSPIPIMQPGDSDEHFNFYLKNSKNFRIAVGGVAGLTASNSISFALKYYSSLFSLSKKKARIHTLGILRWPEILQVKGIRYSDTTTYAGGSRFGEVALFDETEGFTKIRFRDTKHMGQNRPYQRIMSFLRDCNVTEQMMMDPIYHRSHNSIPSFSTVNAYLDFHKFAKTKDITYFFAISGLQWLSPIISVLESKNGRSFDYPLARKRDIEIRNMIKHDFPRAIEVLMDILRRRTRWRMKTK